MARYINAYAFDEYLDKITLVSRDTVKRHLADFPAADVEEVRHGEWIGHIVDASRNIKSIDRDVCSVCRERFYQIAETGCVWRFCPNCGAKMDGGKENENETI